MRQWREKMKDKSKLIIGICFLLAAVYMLFKMFTQEMETFYITGFIIFTIIGIGFTRNAKY
jgi:hypothetical protein